MKSQKQRIGMFGGSFDPPHLGHLIIAEHAREKLELDKVLFLPAHQAPHKIGNHETPAIHRLAMTRLAAKGNPGFAVSDLEIKNRGVSYTVETVKSLSEVYPASDLVLILGGDSLIEFPTWKNPKDILATAELAVYPRRGFETSTPPVPCTVLTNVPFVDISSTLIRRRVLHGKTIRYMVPPEVERYIISRRLYRQSHDVSAE